MPDERFEEHLRFPQGAGHVPDGAHEAVAGGAACGDVARLRIAVAGDRVADAGFEAAGCGATHAAASAAVELVRGAPVFDAARVGTTEIAAALGGLSPASCTPPRSRPTPWRARSGSPWPPTGRCAPTPAARSWP